MRIHTNTDIPFTTVTQALGAAQRACLVDPGIRFTRITDHGSRSHRAAIEVQLGSDVGGRGTLHSHRNQSQTAWAATYDEWGHFLAALFDADPTAKAGPYTGRDDFHRQTSGQYWTAPATSPARAATV